MKAWVNIRSAASFPSMGVRPHGPFRSPTSWSTDSGSSTLTPPVDVWKNTGVPLAWAAAQTGSNSQRPVRLRWNRRQEDGAEARPGDPLDFGHRVVDVGDGDGTCRADPAVVGKEPLDEVIVVDPGVGHRQLVVVGVQPEERQVRDASRKRQRRRSPCPAGSPRGPRRGGGRRTGGTATPSNPRSPGCAAGGSSVRRPRRSARSRSPLPIRPDP